MKTLFHYVTIAILLSSMFFVSCDSGKKLTESRAQVYNLQRDSVNTHKKLNDCYYQVTGLSGENSLMQVLNAKSQNDLKAINSESKLTIAEQAVRLKQLQDLIQSQKDVMFNLRNAIADALLNFSSDELSVYILDGNVYVSLQEELLFKSGSDVVDEKGKDALESLAMVLSETKDITVLVVGHTDNIPIKTNQYKDNWDLSTARATSILRILTDDYGYNANLITASGRGQFHPLVSNATPEGRATNRRTEIILSPDLNELYTLLEQ